MGKTIDDTGARGLEVALMFVNSWPYGEAGNESASFKFDEIFAIAGAAFTMNDERIEVGIILC